MARLIWTEPALADLDGIAEYIAVDNPSAAARFVQKVFDRVERLALYPKSGKCPPELAGMHYREIVVAPCRIFYRVEQDDVFLLHLARSERLLRLCLLEELRGGQR